MALRIRKGYSFKTISNYKRSKGSLLYRHSGWLYLWKSLWLSYQHSYWGWHRSPLSPNQEAKPGFFVKAIRSITSIMTSLFILLEQALWIWVLLTDRYWFWESDNQCGSSASLSGKSPTVLKHRNGQRHSQNSNERPCTWSLANESDAGQETVILWLTVIVASFSYKKRNTSKLTYI